MTTNDFDRTARLFLELGPTTMPDRGLQAALDEIHVTRQRRAWWPARRFSSMSNTIRLAAGAAAVALVTVVGLSLMPSIGLSGLAPAPTPTPTATPTPVPTPIPTPRELTKGSLGPMAPGTYVTGAPFLARVTFTVPAGWTETMGGPYLTDLTKDASPGQIGLSIFDKVYADPCHADKGLMKPQPGPSVGELATALANLPGHIGSKPTDVTLGGYSGKQLTLTAPSSFGSCTLTTDKAFRVWELPLGATLDMTAGEVDRVWILDVAGTRLVIDSPDVPGNPTTEAEIQAILDSIRIAPAR
jgi:hypothetical protein